MATPRTELAPELHTERTIMKLYDPSYIPFILSLLNDPSTIAMMGDMKLRTVEDWSAASAAITLLPEYCNGWSALCLYMVHLRVPQDNANPAGLGERVGIVSLDTNSSTLPDFGYLFRSEVWGRGLATETGTEFYRYIREEMGLKRFIAKTSCTNLKSGNVLKKVGFVHKGRVMFPGPSPGEHQQKELFVLPEMENEDIVLEARVGS